MIRVSNRLVAVALAGTLGFASAASAQSSAFTYQGLLKESGAPANGTADLDFYIYDAPAGGNLVAGPDSHASVPITDGLFTVALDFGPPSAVFDGDPRWLQIEVDGTPMTPRQELTAAPYAHFSALPWETSGNDISYTAGRVGIGTAAPQAALEVAGSPGVDGIMFPDGTMQTSAATGGSGFWSSNGGHIFKNNAGSVGIGIATPFAPLHVYSTTASSADNTAHFTAAGIGPNSSHIHWGPTGDWYIRSASTGGKIVMQDTGGNVGIGTTTPAFPLTIRTVDSIFVDGVGWSHTDGTRDLASIVNSSGGWLGTRSNHPLNFYTNNSSPQITLSTSGQLGIGTTAPTSPLTISNANGGYGLIHTDGSREVGTYVSSSGGWLGTRSNHPLKFFTNDSGAQMTLTTAGNLGIGTSNPSARLDVFGTTRTNILEIVGADVAEKFPTSDQTAEPGTVMEIDPEHPGQLRIAKCAYSSRVAGVVSGAGDLPVGAVLGHLPGTEGSPAIALAGRVWVKCDASTAAIEPGDLLTTAAKPGHAMKAADRDRSHGATLGKAMSELREGTGLVLVLVSLQ